MLSARSFFEALTIIYEDFASWRELNINAFCKNSQHAKALHDLKYNIQGKSGVSEGKQDYVSGNCCIGNSETVMQKLAGDQRLNDRRSLDVQALKSQYG
jgi:hypothetical protein